MLLHLSSSKQKYSSIKYNRSLFSHRSIDSNDLETLLFDRLGRFLRTHTIKVDLKGSDILGAIESAGRSFDENSDTALDEGRGKKSKFSFF